MSFCERIVCEIRGGICHGVVRESRANEVVRDRRVNKVVRDNQATRLTG